MRPVRSALARVPLLALVLTSACRILTGPPADGRVVVHVDGATCGAQTFTVDVFVAGEHRARQTVSTTAPGAPIAVPPGTWAISARVVNSTMTWTPLMAAIPENGTYIYLLACPTVHALPRAAAPPG